MPASMYSFRFSRLRSRQGGSEGMLSRFRSEGLTPKPNKTLADRSELLNRHGLIQTGAAVLCPVISHAKTGRDLRL